jgi:hypothetical protein
MFVVLFEMSSRTSIQYDYQMEKAIDGNNACMSNDAKRYMQPMTRK